MIELTRNLCQTLTTVHRGQHVPLNAATPQAKCAYLAQVIAIDTPNSPIAAERAQCPA